jgi:hypothetical protein
MFVRVNAFAEAVESARAAKNVDLLSFIRSKYDDDDDAYRSGIAREFLNRFSTIISQG